MESFIESIPRILISSGFRYFIFAGIPFLIFYVFFKKNFQKNKIQHRSEKRKQFIREIKHSLSTLIVITLFAAIVFFSPFREFTKIYSNIYAYSLWWIPISVVLSLVIHDTYFYWMHRLVHQKSIYKYTHRVHHQSINPSPWTSYSFDVLEAILENMVLFILVFAIPIHPLAALIFGLTSFAINVYGHLGYEIVPQWFRHSFLFEILNTSVYHNLHHKKFHGNYGLYFRVWDRLLGTENPEYVKGFDEIQKRRFGNSISKNKSFTSVGALFLLLGIFSFSFTKTTSPQPDITGTWVAHGEIGKGIIQIYQDRNQKIQGKLIRALDKKHQTKINETKSKNAIEDIFVLQNFEYVKDSLWENGQLFSMNRKRHLNGKLKLLPSGELQVTGVLMRWEKTFVWRKQIQH